MEEEKEKKLREDKKKESEDLTKLNDEKISINIKKETNESDSEPKVSNEWAFICPSPISFILTANPFHSPKHAS